MAAASVSECLPGCRLHLSRADGCVALCSQGGSTHTQLKHMERAVFWCWIATCSNPHASAEIAGPSSIVSTPASIHTHNPHIVYLAWRAAGLGQACSYLLLTTACHMLMTSPAPSHTSCVPQTGDMTLDEIRARLQAQQLKEGLRIGSSALCIPTKPGGPQPPAGALKPPQLAEIEFPSLLLEAAPVTPDSLVRSLEVTPESEALPSRRILMPRVLRWSRIWI